VVCSFSLSKRAFTHPLLMSSPIVQTSGLRMQTQQRCFILAVSLSLCPLPSRPLLSSVTLSPLPCKHQRSMIEDQKNLFFQLLPFVLSSAWRTRKGNKLKHTNRQTYRTQTKKTAFRTNTPMDFFQRKKEPCRCLQLKHVAHGVK